MQYPRHISGQKGTATLVGEGVGVAMSSNALNSLSLKINTETPDNIIKEYVPADKRLLIKMDIEGAEKLVFKNLNFLGRIYQISMELNGNDNFSEIPKILKSNGFSIVQYNIKTQIKNSVIIVIKHPISFINSERKTGCVGLKGIVATIKGRNPVPSNSKADNGGVKLKMITATKL
jgi:hypothetical protein